MKNNFFKLSIAVSLFMALGNIQIVSASDNINVELNNELPKEMTWTNIVIRFNDTTLEDLASTYYGDVKEASLIYEANRDVIPKSKKLHKGMKLKLPITDKFRDQPERLGWQ